MKGKGIVFSRSWLLYKAITVFSACYVRHCWIICS